MAISLDDRVRAELEFAGLEVASIEPRCITIKRPDGKELHVMAWRGSPLSEIVTVARKGIAAVR